MIQNVKHAPNKNGDHVNAKKDKEEEKVAIIAASDAIVHPRAVMVKCLYDLRKKKKWKQSTVSKGSDRKWFENVSVALLPCNHANLYACVANAAVRTSWRSIEFACGAPFNSHCHSVDFNVAIKWIPKIVIVILFRARWIAIESETNHRLILNVNPIGR